MGVASREVKADTKIERRIGVRGITKTDGDGKKKSKKQLRKELTTGKEPQQSRLADVRS